MRRLILPLLIAGVACGGNSPTAPQAPTTRRVTLVAQDVPLPIPRRNGGFVQSTLTVSGLAGTLTDVRVTVDVDQGPACELVIGLRHPDGTFIELFTVAPPGFGCPNRLFTTFPTNTPTPSARDLTTLRGKPANGPWVLHVGDERAGLLVAPPYILRAWQLDLTVQQ